MKYLPLLSLLAAAPLAHAQLLITEINSNGAGGDFWELTNVGTSSVDLTNYKWNDSARLTGTPIAIPAGTTIAAGESIVFNVTGDAAAFRSAWGIAGSVQVLSSGGNPGLGSGDAITLINAANQEVLYLSYAAGGFIRSDGSNSVAGHAGVSAGGAATVSLVLDPNFPTSAPRYAAAVVSTFGAFAHSTAPTTIGSPGVSGLSVAPPSLTLSLGVTNSSFSESASNPASVGTVTRTGATTSALVVTLSSSDATEATVPASVTIPIGLASAPFDITAVNDNFPDGNKSAIITASATDATAGTTTLTVNDDGDEYVQRLLLTEVLSQQAAAGVNDFWELTNISAVTVSLEGYSWHDNGRSASAAQAYKLPAGASIAPGESVIFCNLAPTAFRTWWNIPNSVQVFQTAGPGLGQNDGVSFFDEGQNEIFFFNYAAGGFTKADGNPSTGTHSGPSAGASTETQSAVWDPASGTVRPRYTFATVGNLGAFASAANALDIASPGVTVGVPSVSIASAAAAEGNSGTSTLALNVTRTDLTAAFTVDYAVTGGTADGTDFNLASGTLNFTAAGAASLPIDITVNGDTTTEPNETVVVTLSNLVNTTGTTILGTAVGTATITNDDVVAPLFATQPASTSITSGGVATLTLVATGSPTPAIQWYQGNSGDTTTPVGTNSPIFTSPILNATTNYWARISNTGGPLDSDTITVTVAPGATAVDLTTYVRVGRFGLPEPTRTPLPAGTATHNLLCQEASAVTYNWDTDTLFISCDGGRSITQVSKTGQLIDTMSLDLQAGAPQGAAFYDPEGITYIGGGQFVFSEERDQQLVKFTYVAGTTLTRAAAQTVDLGPFDDNTGTEGLSWDPPSSDFICLKEKSPIGVFRTSINFTAGTSSVAPPSVGNEANNLFNTSLLGMSDVADVFAFTNIPSMVGQPQGDNLLIVGQENARIVNISRTGSILSTLNIAAQAGDTINVADMQHEGITMDRVGNIYVVNENGGGNINFPELWVYAVSTAPNAAATAVAVNNALISIEENSSTASPVKLGDIVVTDDGLGTNALSLNGADANSFEITGSSLFLKAGVTLDFETKASYTVTINADDTTVGPTPDATVNFVLTVTDQVVEIPAPPVLLVTEVAPWSSSNSPLAADWFEVTNVGSAAVNITGWKVDDSSNAFATAITLNGITSIAPGESVIFVEGTVTTAASFKTNWFGVSPPVGLQVGFYSGSGIGLSTNGDAVNLFNAFGVRHSGASFGAADSSSPYQTFDNTAAVNDAVLSLLSIPGVNAAFFAANTAEIGSPGYSAPGVLRVTEVAPWSSGNSPVAADWFEVTNIGARAVDLTGWKVDDSSESPAAALPLTGITSIAPGESVIFIETGGTQTASGNAAAFRSNWFGASPPAALQIGAYTGGGIGLSTGGDAVNLYDTINVRQVNVSFGVSPSSAPFTSFDNAAAANVAAITQFSATGVNGAFVAVNSSSEVGSPGTTNLAPSLINSIAGQSSTKGAAFSFSLPAGLFADAPGQTLTFSATRADGSPLPSWLTFNPATGAFSGTPTAVDLGNLVVKVIATDNGTPGLASSALFTIAVAPASGSAYFPQSVASGDPRSSSVVLWTRLMDGDTAVNRTVTLHLSTTGTTAAVGTTAALGGANIWTGGNLTSKSAHDGVVKVKATGLTADTTYYYQFTYNGNRSPIGRTKTAPAAGSTRTVKYAAINCNDFVGRYFNVLRQLAEREQDSIDFVLNLGDYVYETTGDPSFQTSLPERAMVFSNPAEAINLGSGNFAAQSVGNYRDIYKTIRQDAQLQRVHELFPMISIWDDHEFSDDNWKDNATYFDGKVNEQQTSRKRNGEQAWMEFLPTERGMASAGNSVEIDSTDLYPNTVIYDAFNFGTNLDLILTDIRTNRADHLIPEEACPSGIPMTENDLIATLAAVNGLDVPTFTAAAWPGIRGSFAPYVNIDDSAYSAVKAGFKAIIAASVNSAMASLPAGQTPTTTGAAYADANVVGFRDASFINQAFVAAGDAAPFDSAALAAMPRGLSYYLMGKTSVFSDFGSRYQVVNPTFQLFAGFTYQAFVLSSGALGRDQAFYDTAQQTFLATALANSTAAGNKWRVVASSTPYTPIKFELGDLPAGVSLPTQGIISGVTIPASLPSQFLVEFLLNADEPAGFPQFRQGMIDLFAQHDAIIVSGDIHAGLIGKNNASNGQKVIDFTVPSASSSEFRRAITGAFSSVEGLMTPGVQQATGLPGSFAFDTAQKQAVINATDAIIKHNTTEMFQADTATHGYTVFSAGSSAFNADYQKIDVSEIDDNLYGLSAAELDSKFSTQNFAVGKSGVGAASDLTLSEVDFTLQVLHLADAEAGLLASSTAPNLAALVDGFDGAYPNTLILAGGDNFIPGPFIAGGTDISVRDELNTVTGSTMSLLSSFNHPTAAVDIAIHNVIGVEASTIGNHEFDLGTRVFRDSFQPGSGWVGASFPYLSANLDFARDSDIFGRYTNTLSGDSTSLIPEANTLNGRIAPAAVITKGGEKIGLVAVTTQILESISSTGGVEVKGFEGDGLETNDMALLASQIQPAIDKLKSEGVDKIILMAHLQQITFEQQLAPLLNGVDIILAAGSNTRLGDSNDVPALFTGHTADFDANYPIYTAGSDGLPTVIVNTDNEFTYLGRLVADFDADGVLIVPNLTANIVENGAYAATDANVAAAWNTTVGNLASTAFAANTKGAKVKLLTDAVQAVINAKDGDVRGYTDVYLEGERNIIRNQETNLGDITADSMISVARTALPTATHIVGFKNGGGIRSSIGAVDVVSGVKTPPIANPSASKPAGAVSLLDIENSLRFNNGLMVCDTTPAGLKAILEHGVFLLGTQGRFPQIGGIRFSYNPSATAGSRVQSIVLVDENDNITGRVVSGGLVRSDAPALITLVTLNFLAGNTTSPNGANAAGGDGYPFRANADNFRYLLNNGSLSPSVNEDLDFSSAANVPVNILGEQLALSNYLQARYATQAAAYDIADAAPALDTRIQSTAVRTDTVPNGLATFNIWLADNGLMNGNSDGDSDTLTDLQEFAFGLNRNSPDNAGLSANIPAGTLTARGTPTIYSAPTQVGQDFRYVFIRVKNAASVGITYSPQFSNDMSEGTWESRGDLPVTVIASDGDYELVSVKYPFFTRGKKAQFARMAVSQN